MTPTPDPGAANRDSPDPSPRNAHGSSEVEDKFTKSCRQKARWINAAICFGIDIQDIFKVGIRSETQDRAGSNNNADDADDDEDQDTSYIPTLEETPLLKAYHDILRFIPKIKKILPYQPDADEEYFEDLIEAIQSGCNAARSESTRRVKDQTINYLRSGRAPVSVGQHITHKALRGLHDPDTGRLIIPADHVQEWDEDTDATRASFLSGTYSITGCDMPLFLYEDYAYNPEDPEEGLFRGAFLVCVLIDILFGTNSVDVSNVKRVDQPRHHCLGEMYGLLTISPQNIAYAAVVARFCLSSQRTWNIKDNVFNYRTFYRAILLRLEDSTDPWVQDTIGWWNERVFGNERGKLPVDEAAELANEQWNMFTRRRAGRKAAQRGVEARLQAIAGGSGQDEPPSTPPPSLDMIDPSLFSTSNLSNVIDSRTVPQTPDAPVPSLLHSPTVPQTPDSLAPSLLPSPSVPQTPDGPAPSLLPSPLIHQAPDPPGPSLQPSPSIPWTPDPLGPSPQPENDSPLSNISNEDVVDRTTRTQPTKRKGPALNADRPRARPKRKATQA